MAEKTLIIIPVENQVREFDPKLLLAVMAARRGFPVVIGSRAEIDFRIAAFPPSIYLAKSMTTRSVTMFKIMRRLGHLIAVTGRPNRDSWPTPSPLLTRRRLSVTTTAMRSPNTPRTCAAGTKPGNRYVSWSRRLCLGIHRA